MRLILDLKHIQYFFFFFNGIIHFFFWINLPHFGSLSRYVSKGVILFAGLLFWHDLNYTKKPEFHLLKALTIENPDSAIFT